MRAINAPRYLPRLQVVVGCRLKQFGPCIAAANHQKRASIGFKNLRGGRNKTAILRAIKAGKISVAKDEKGEWQIDPELHRIYPPLQSASMRGKDMLPQLHQSQLLTPV